ncbi:TPA: hypothetical protein HA246_02025 [Candidatus Woesearchaeota archaeon]|nr:hypothetical protein [Candidatus Woesearchaeota archaeon]HIH42399.1 hypothetical protein [Candidatus Woesearchaeota archaeon]
MDAPEIDKTEYLDVVDNNDKVLYQEKRTVIDEKKLLHRSVLCFVMNSNKKIFVHVKHDGKMKLQKEEIIDGRFMSIAEIDAMIAKGEKFCPDELQIFEKFKMMIKEGKV